MAASELEIEPDLNKAPPHVEGELLKQNTRAILGKRGWRKYYFIVLSAKLLYYRKREDYKVNKEPIAYIRMSQVTEITEVIFSGVPKKHHLNCGFSIMAFHPITQEQLTINLLAETPEDMRYWVHALRYIKAYWSKIKIRETVLSDDQERKLLERIFKDEEDNRDDELSGEYTLDEDGQVSSAEGLSVPMSVFFYNGTKDKVIVSSQDTTADLLEKSAVKGRLSSSTSYLWLVDNEGHEYILDSKDRPALYLPKAKKFYALDHSYRVLVIFFSRTREFESIVVHSHTTVCNVIEHCDIEVQLDIRGVTNRGLFLKTPEEEILFSNTECPCEVLFEIDSNGLLKRQPVGNLVIRNKALGGGRSTARITRRIMRSIKRPQRTISDDGRQLSLISEKEDAEEKALELLLKKKKGPAFAEDMSDLDEDWLVPTEQDLGMTSSDNAALQYQSEPMNIDPRGFEDNVYLGSELTRAASIPTRPRSSAVGATDSPKLGDRRSTGSSHSPSRSPIGSPRRRRSKSPRRLPELPPKDGSPRVDSKVSHRSDSSGSDGSPMRRRNATRAESRRKSEKPSTVSIASNKKGPTIVLPDSLPLASHIRENVPSPPISRNRSPTVRAAVTLMDIGVNDSRSSSFGHNNSSASSPTVSSPVPLLKHNGAHSQNVMATHDCDDEDRLENVLSLSYQQEQEAQKTKNYAIVDTLSDKVQRFSESETTVERKTSKDTADSDKSESPEMPFRPMVIDFKKLQSHQIAPPTNQTPPTEIKENSLTDSLISSIEPTKPSAAIDVLSPSLLKVILLQSSETVDVSIETKPMDFISLSGVCLRNDRGIWRIQDGCNYHDPLPFDCDDHTETFPLPGGIRAIYNHTHKRWHVLPSHTPNATPSGDDSQSVVDSNEHAQYAEEQDGRSVNDENSIYLRKKAVVTEIGKAFHEIMGHFEKTRDHSEKKRIGSDMTNPAMGHLIRGQFCSALAALLLNGLRPYRLEGLVQDDIWKVTLAFCNEAQSNAKSPLVFPDKLIIQPINALKDLMKDNNIKFRTFICLSMSKGVLTSWLEALPRQRNVLNKYYLPNAFLRLVSEYPHYQKLYEQMLLTLEPMAHLPFDLSIDFEKKQYEEAARVARQQEEARTMLNTGQSSSTQSSPSQTPQRSVVVKTHAATGQRSTAGNVINAVWETSPVPNNLEEVDNSEEPSPKKEEDEQISSSKSIEQQHSTVVQKQQQQQPVQTTPSSSKSRQTQTRGRGTWLKILSDSFQQLNMGGAITGTPKKTNQVEQKQTMESVDGNERRVEALYNNIADDADELSFVKGDVMIVKEQINAEWLICSLESETGIVPANYVRPI